MLAALRLLLDSRKFVVMVVTAFCSAVSTIALRFGFQVDAVTLSGVVVPIVITGIAVIFGIAKEDAAKYAASSGMTVTTTTPHGSVTSGPAPNVVVNVEPDPTGKP